MIILQRFARLDVEMDIRLRRGRSHLERWATLGWRDARHRIVWRGCGCRTLQMEQFMLGGKLYRQGGRGSHQMPRQ